MRALSADLLAAQRSPSAAPYLHIELHDRVSGVRRLAWTRVYSGAEPDGYHAACVPADDSLIRARVTGGRVYYQRVTSPGPGSTYSSWADLGAAADAGVALCADGARVLLFYIDPGGTVIKVRESTDNGATLGAAVTAANASGAATWLAADVKPGGDAALIYNVGAAVYAARRTSGAWGAAAAWPNSVASVAGVACHHSGDWNVAIAGADASDNDMLWTAVFGDGFSQTAGTWSALRELMRASPGSAVTYRAPFLVRSDTAHLTFVEKFTGVAAYARPLHSHSPAAATYSANLWREPAPFDLQSDFGQAIAFGTNAAWLSTPSGVWMAGVVTPTLDVTADVLECTTRDAPFAGEVRLVLRNDDGRYSALAAPLKLGAEVRVGPGYRTAGGPAFSEGPSYWTESTERRTGRGEGSVVITARNGWALLDAWRARRTFAWAAGERTVFAILAQLFARVGLEFSGISPSSEATATLPAFTVHPNESALTAVRRLLSLVPDVIFLRRESAFITEPLATDASVYSYGGAHAIYSARYADRSAANRVQVFGKNVFGERFDWPSVALASDRLLQVLDANATTQALAEAHADALLANAMRAATSCEITVPVNCGQELHDVIDVTDAGAGLSAAKRRVAAIELRYSTTDPARYEQKLTLEAV